MPFTPAHPAIVLPLIKRYPRFFSDSGLIIGSITPDFEYFFKMAVKGTHSHTWLGSLYFDIPVATALAFIFHLIVKRNLITNLPEALQERYRPLLDFDFVPFFKKHFIIFFISVWIGTATHIIWDSFTHNSGYFARTLPIYGSTYIPFDGVNYPLFYVLQHISTIIGLIIIFIYIIFMDRHSQIAKQRPSVFYWLSVSAITGGIVLLRFIVKSSDFNLGNFVVSSISGFCLALMLAGLKKS